MFHPSNRLAELQQRFPKFYSSIDEMNGEAAWHSGAAGHFDCNSYVITLILPLVSGCSAVLLDQPVCLACFRVVFHCPMVSEQGFLSSLSLPPTLSLMYRQPFQESSAVFTSTHTNTNCYWVNDNHLWYFWWCKKTEDTKNEHWRYTV